MMKQRHLQWLLVAHAVILFVPGAIVIASMVLSSFNESAGLLRYRLPEIFFWTFLATGVASPVVGISTLGMLWRHRRQWALSISSNVERRLRIAVILASVVAVMAPAIWSYFFGDVFFVAGGNR